MYEGDFKGGLFNGNGVFTYKTGNKIEGYFLDNKLHGEALLIDKSGWTGNVIFKNGKSLT